MEETTKPKRIEFRSYAKEGEQRSLGLCISKEVGNDYKDYYLYLNLWWWNFTLVFLRF